MGAKAFYAYLKSQVATSAELFTVRKYRVAKSVIKVQFSNKKALYRFDAAFFACDPDTPEDLSVYVWDGPGVEASWSVSDYKQKGAVRGFEDPEFPLVYDIGARALSCASLKDKQAFYWAPDLGQLPFWEWGAPLRNIIHWFLPQQSLRLAHAAAVGKRGEGVLIVGKGGSGKSSLALASLRLGMSYCSDDYCALGCNPLPEVASVYATAKIKMDMTKQVVLIDQLFPGQRVESLSLKAIVYPRICHRDQPRLVVAPKSALMKELAVSSVLQLPGANREFLPLCKEVVMQLPTYTLELSENHEKNALMVEELLEKKL